MKRIQILVLLLGIRLVAFTQTEEVKLEQEQLLETTGEAETAIENEGDLIDIDYLKRHPINLNKAVEEELKILSFLTQTQIENFLLYRAVMGQLLHIYELQAIPDWDVRTIRRVAAYVWVADSSTLKSKFLTEWKNGEHLLLIRLGNRIGNEPNQKMYEGSSTALLLKYTYRYQNEFRVGLTGDKDAGETFFRKNNRKGFDFYSGHLFIQPKKGRYTIALGDYVIQLGQGLTQWQGLAFGKSSETMTINRQGSSLKPYTSSGEYIFHRGIAFQQSAGHWNFLGFVSKRRLSANAVVDSLAGTRHFSSIQTSGYHRTAAEIADKNQLSLFSVGTAAHYNFHKGLIGAQMLWYQFSDILQKERTPFNYYSFQGKRLANWSIDGRYTFRNIHFFGETAFDQDFSTALVAGMIVGLGRGLDFSFLYRRHSKDYHSLFSNSFAEYSSTINEEGLYMGIQYKPGNRWRASAYSDIFRSQWIRAGLNSRPIGWKYLLQVNYDPSKTTAAYIRFRHQQYLDGYAESASTGLRIHVQQRFHPNWEWRGRLETNWIWEQKRTITRGVLLFSDLFFEPIQRPYAFSFRLLFFDTNGYGARLYAFEPDVLYSYNTPAFFGRGLRWVINGKLKCGNLFGIKNQSNVSIWIKLAQTIEGITDVTVVSRPNMLKISPLDLRIQILSTF